MAAPNHEEDEEIEDPEVDEQMDPGIRIGAQQRSEDEDTEENPHDEEPDVADDEMT